jgi:hypothetical protein
MKAWARAAGKLARYEHIGWNEWPQSRCCSFHSGAIPIGGSAPGAPGTAGARPRASWDAGGSSVAIDSSLGRGAEHTTGDSRSIGPRSCDRGAGTVDPKDGRA